MKKVLGIVLTVVGGLLLASGLRLAIFRYDLSTTTDRQKAVGAIGIPLAMIAVGVAFLSEKKKS